MELTIRKLVENRLNNIAPEKMENYFMKNKLVYEPDLGELLSRIYQQIELDVLENYETSMNASLKKLIDHVGNGGVLTIEINDIRTNIVLHEKEIEEEFFESRFIAQNSLKNKVGEPWIVKNIIVFDKIEGHEKKLMEALTINSLAQTEYAFYKEDYTAGEIIDLVKDTVEIFEDLKNKKYIASPANKEFFDSKKGNNKEAKDKIVLNKLRNNKEAYKNLLENECELYYDEEEKENKNKVLKHYEEFNKTLLKFTPLSINQKVSDFQNIMVSNISVRDLIEYEIAKDGFNKEASLYNLVMNTNTKNIKNNLKELVEQLKNYPLDFLNNQLFSNLIKDIRENNLKQLLENNLYSVFKELSMEEKVQKIIEWKNEGFSNMQGLIFLSEIREGNFEDAILSENNKKKIALPKEVLSYEASSRGFRGFSHNGKDMLVIFDEEISENVKPEIFVKKINDILNDKDLFIKDDNAAILLVATPLPPAAKLNYLCINKHIREMNILSSLDEKATVNKKKI